MTIEKLGNLFALIMIIGLTTFIALQKGFHNSSSQQVAQTDADTAAKGSRSQ